MRFVLLTLSVVLLFSCKEAPKELQKTANSEDRLNITETTEFPEALEKVFAFHGGLEAWKSAKTLVFEIPKSENPETHTIDLQTRKDRVESEAYSMGFDGSEVWLLDAYENYSGDAVFYHNLMFYFYAMPFVLADKGIRYGETQDLVFEGKSYPGIGISYDAGVGTSPKDEYFVHYDPETYEMAWLGYTVTYRSGQKSDNVRWIRYDNWMKTDGLILPKAITWHGYEGRVIKEVKNTVEFQNVALHKTSMPHSFYEVPEGGNVVVRKRQ